MHGYTLSVLARSQASPMPKAVRTTSASIRPWTSPNVTPATRMATIWPKRASSE